VTRRLPPRQRGGLGRGQKGAEHFNKFDAMTLGVCHPIELLFRGHAERAVQPDDFAVEHRVLDDALYKLRIL
jgi:hypothetical protein